MSAGQVRDEALGLLGLVASGSEQGRKTLAAIRLAVAKVEAWLDCGDPDSPYVRLSELAMRLRWAREHEPEDLPAAAEEAEALIRRLALILDPALGGTLGGGDGDPA